MIKKPARPELFQPEKKGAGKKKAKAQADKPDAE